MRCLVQKFIALIPQGKANDGKITGPNGPWSCTECTFIHADKGQLSLTMCELCHSKRDTISEAEKQQQLVEQEPQPFIRDFLCWARSCSEVVGLHAFRLATELIHQHVMSKLTDVGQLDYTFTLGSHRGAPRPTNVVTRTDILESSGKGSSSTQPTAEGQDFTWKEYPGRSENLNEAYICTGLSNSVW
jgi:hypothetical protein